MPLVVARIALGIGLKLAPIHAEGLGKGALVSAHPLIHMMVIRIVEMVFHKLLIEAKGCPFAEGVLASEHANLFVHHPEPFHRLTLVDEIAKKDFFLPEVKTHFPASAHALAGAPAFVVSEFVVFLHVASFGS